MPHWQLRLVLAIRQHHRHIGKVTFHTFVWTCYFVLRGFKNSSINLFQKKYLDIHYSFLANPRMSNFMRNEVAKQMNPSTFFTTDKPCFYGGWAVYRELYFKTFNDILSFRQRFNFDHNNCTFCDEEIETKDHLFFSCLDSNTFWNDMHDRLETRVPSLSYFTRNYIRFGTIMEKMEFEFLSHPIDVWKKMYA